MANWNRKKKIAFWRKGVEMKVLHMPRINWAAYLLIAGVAMLAVGAMYTVKVTFLTGGDKEQEIQRIATALYFYLREDSLLQEYVSYNWQEANDSIMVSLPGYANFVRIVGHQLANPDSVTFGIFPVRKTAGSDSLFVVPPAAPTPAPIAQAQQQPTKKPSPVPFWQKTWFVWMVIGVVAGVVIIWFIKNPPSRTLGPEAWLIILTIALIVCWALFFRADWQFMIWPATFLPLVIFVYIRKVALDNWWKAANHPIAYVYLAAWLVMFFIVIVAGIKNHGGSF